MTTITELKKLAEAATPGPYKFGLSDYDDTYQQVIIEKSFDYRGPGYCENPSIFGANGERVVGCDEYYIFGSPNDAEYIAAANPETILHILAVIEEMAGALRKYQKRGSMNDLESADYAMDAALAKYKEMK